MPTKSPTQEAPVAAEEQCDLGTQYYLKENYARAKELYIQAAAQGDAMAKYNLGIMYARGRGVKQNDKQGNDKQAVEWYTKAAEQGHPKALYNLELRSKVDRHDTGIYHKVNSTLSTLWPKPPPSYEVVEAAPPSYEVVAAAATPPPSYKEAANGIELPKIPLRELETIKAIPIGPGINLVPKESDLAEQLPQEPQGNVRDTKFAAATPDAHTVRPYTHRSP